MWRKNNPQACRDMFMHATSGHYMSYAFLSSGHYIYSAALWAPKATVAATGSKCAVQNQADRAERMY